MNSESGLFTLEVLGGLAVLAYLLFKIEKDVFDPLEGLLGDDDDDGETDAERAAAAVIAHYREILAHGDPHAGSGQDEWDIYTDACHYVSSHPNDFTSAEVSQANRWLAYMAQQQAEHGTTPPPEETAESPAQMMDDTISRIVNGAYPEGTTNAYAQRFLTACIVVLEPQNDGVYAESVKQRAGRWWYWIQWPNTAKPVGSATDPNARETDTVNVPPPPGEARPGSGHDPGEEHEHYNRQSRKAAPGIAVRGEGPKSLFYVGGVGPQPFQKNGFAGYPTYIRPSFQGNDGFSRRLYTV